MLSTTVHSLLSFRYFLSLLSFFFVGTQKPPLRPASPFFPAKYSKMLALLISLSLCLVANAAELALYWGQASAGSQKSLGEYCSSTPGDIYIVSFLSSFSADGKITLNVAGACETTFPGSSLLHCPNIAQDIKTCQSQGKKVLLSLGGAAGTYGFSSDSDGTAFAQTLWDTFGGGSTDQRPFDDAVFDGFDFDIENNNQAGYVALAQKLRQLFSSHPSKQFYLSAAPQCPFPDASVGDLLSKAQIDYAFIQFYNNYCSTTGSQFNWDTWQNFATNASPNKSIKLFLGLPGSSSAAGSGYADPDQVKQTLGQISSSSNYGGISVWDASQADLNVVGGKSFLSQLGTLVGSGSGSGSGSSPAPASSQAAVAAGSSTGKTTSSPVAATLVANVQNNAVVNVNGASSSEPTTTVQVTVTVTHTSENVNTLTGTPSLAVLTDTPKANYKYTPGSSDKNAWTNSTTGAQDAAIQLKAQAGGNASTTDNLGNKVKADLSSPTAKWSNDTTYTTVVRSHIQTVTVTVSPGASGTADAFLKLKGAANINAVSQNTQATASAAAGEPTVTTVPAPVTQSSAGDGPTTYYTTTVKDTITVTLPRSSSQVAVSKTVSPAITTSSAAAPSSAASSNGTQPVKREAYENKYNYQHRHHARRYIGIVV